MSCLLYGIVVSPSDGQASPALPAGVGGAPVRLLRERGLGAAVSAVNAHDLTPNVARALSYAKVVEALHAHRAVLPMRYGCVFGDEGQVIELLRAHGEDYAAVLRGLDGCVEMGVRVLLPSGPPSPGFPPRSEMKGASGRAYLADRAARHAREEEDARALTAVMERLRGALGGLAERTETDRNKPRADPRVSSLYFLIRRGAVEAFRRAFRQLERTESARLLLSGPWPPYNFVAPEGHWEQPGPLI